MHDSDVCEVRQLGADCVGEVVAVCERVLRDTWVIEETLAGVLEGFASEKSWTEFFSTRAVFGAYVGGRLAGVATVHDVGSGVAYFAAHNVVLRGRGIGGALTSARIDYARNLGVARVQAHVDRGNAASIRNLVRFGFERVAEHPAGDGYEPVDMYELVLR
jgi:RimJ/RimL family protein N-acetyltransferase